MVSPPETCDGFLPWPYAERLFAFLSAVPVSEWYWNIRPAGEDGSDWEVRNSPENAALIEAARQHAHRAMLAGAFAYAYLRIRHRLGCDCPICGCERLLVSEETLKRVSETTGRKLTQHKAVFCSWYAPGCFLSTHTDVDNGRIAFVYQLTKRWRAEYGGCLTMLAPDLAEPSRPLTPGFNRLVLFEVSESDPTPHFVSCVNAGVEEKRWAIAGWYY
jgi:hypothetical protein